MASILSQYEVYFIRMNLSYFLVFTSVFCKSAFSCVFRMITTIEETLLGTHGSLVNIIYYTCS